MEHFTAQSQSKKIDQLHLDTKHWMSGIDFTQDEMLFIERLLHSYVFEPNTHNLFERLQNFEDRLKKTMVKKKSLQVLIRKHECNLGGMLECSDSECDLTYYRKHDQLKAEVVAFQEEFRLLKSEIFNYAGGILKKRKPVE